MAKTANAPRQAENEARAVARHIRISPRKLNLVAQLIRGKNCGRALTDLEFCKRRVAQDVKKVLESAVANAENNHQLDVDRLFVKEATVGKAFVMKRFRAGSRGRVSRRQKPFSRLTIVVQERGTEQKKATPKAQPKKATKKTADKASAAPAKKKAPSSTAKKKKTSTKKEDTK